MIEPQNQPKPTLDRATALAEALPVRDKDQLFALVKEAPKELSAGLMGALETSHAVENFVTLDARVQADQIGGFIPLLPKRMGQGSAMVSSPLLTTVIGMTGFFFALSLAALMMPWMV